ncbi:hypothetical protein WJ01_01205 [Burkholderia vietnamiensis]|nr:hypothetical protein WJ01_01205 [Burkholderia vietnamiensis]
MVGVFATPLLDNGRHVAVFFRLAAQSQPLIHGTTDTWQDVFTIFFVVRCKPDVPKFFDNVGGEFG